MALQKRQKSIVKPVLLEYFKTGTTDAKRVILSCTVDIAFRCWKWLSPHLYLICLHCHKAQYKEHSSSEWMISYRDEGGCRLNWWCTMCFGRQTKRTEKSAKKLWARTHWTNRVLLQWDQLDRRTARTDVIKVDPNNKATYFCWSAVMWCSDVLPIICHWQLIA